MVARVNFRADARHEFGKIADDVLLDFDEASGVLGISPHTLRAWRRDGKGPRGVKLGERSVRFSAGELRQWVAGQRKAS